MTLSSGPQSLSTADSPSYCPSNTFTTQNGYQFKTYCGSDLLAKEVGSLAETSMADCMDQCSWFQPACYGVTYYPQNQTCSFKAAGVNSTMLSTSKSDNTNVNSAIANATQMVPLDITCPYQNYSIVEMGDGLSFEILCAQDIVGYDFFPWGYSYQSHTNTMKECMELCVHAHPLCLSISWNPSLVDGYGNCFLKTSKGNPVPVLDGTTHSALVNLPVIDGCKEQQEISSHDKRFNVTCFEGRVGSSNMTSLYSANITGCIDHCATYTGQDPCLAVFYDNSFTDGFENCYLLNVTGSKTAPLNATYAELVTSNNATSASESSVSATSTSATSTSTTSKSATSLSSSTPSSSSTSSSSSSKAWIAGPVVGTIAAVAILVLGLFWLRRRVRQKQDKNPAPVELWNPPEAKASVVNKTPSHYVPEMGATPMHELESN